MGPIRPWSIVPEAISRANPGKPKVWIANDLEELLRRDGICSLSIRWSVQGKSVRKMGCSGHAIHDRCGPVPALASVAAGFGAPRRGALSERGASRTVA